MVRMTSSPCGPGEAAESLMGRRYGAGRRWQARRRQGWS
jgi:hypothetical protein